MPVSICGQTEEKCLWGGKLHDVFQMEHSGFHAKPRLLQVMTGAVGHFCLSECGICLRGHRFMCINMYQSCIRAVSVSPRLLSAFLKVKWVAMETGMLQRKVSKHSKCPLLSWRHSMSLRLWLRDGVCRARVCEFCRDSMLRSKIGVSSAEASQTSDSHSDRAVIPHVLTGVKRLDADNTAVSGTLSPDDCITLLLHCSHSRSNLIKIQVIGISVTERQMTAKQPPVECSSLHVWLKCLQSFSFITSCVHIRLRMCTLRGWGHQSSRRGALAVNGRKICFVSQWFWFLCVLFSSKAH